MRPKLADDDPRHGTYNGYNNLGCRCPPCTAENTRYLTEWRHMTGRNRTAEGRAAVRVGRRQPCGTYAAYVRHYRYGETPCDACRQASWTYRRLLRSMRLRECP